MLEVVFEPRPCGFKVLDLSCCATKNGETGIPNGEAEFIEESQYKVCTGRIAVNQCDYKVEFMAGNDER